MRSEHYNLTEDSRAEPRKLMALTGQIIFDGGTTILNCSVHNLSDHDARLVMSNPVGVPDSFTLKIKRDRYCHLLPVRATRRDGEYIDVEFDDANELRLLRENSEARYH